MPRKPKVKPASAGFWKELAQLPPGSPTPPSVSKIENPAVVGTVLPRAAEATRAFEEGRAQGFKEALAAIAQNQPLAALLHAEAEWDAATPERRKQLAMAYALRHFSTGESPAVKSARKRRVQRMARDGEQAEELAGFIRAGDTTEQARHRFKPPLGVVRAQRVRALAVKLGLLQPRKQGPKTP